MKLAANIVTLTVVGVSLLNVGQYNALAVDAATTLLMLFAATLYATNKYHRAFITVALFLAMFCWTHQQYGALSDFTDFFVTLTFFLCVPSNASLLLCIKTVINIPLRVIDPSGYMIAEIAAICLCLYLFYDTKQILSTYFPQLRNNGGHRKSGI